MYSTYLRYEEAPSPSEDDVLSESVNPSEGVQEDKLPDSFYDSPTNPTKSNDVETSSQHDDPTTPTSSTLPPLTALDNPLTHTNSVNNDGRHRIRRMKYDRQLWTPEEDNLLRLAVHVYGDKTEKWAKIAACVPGRTNKNCRKRWFHSLDPSLRKGPWTAEEDEKLRQGVEMYPNQWSKIADMIPGRTDDQCAKRWRESLDPAIDRSNWSSEDDALLMEKYKQLGSQWQQIAMYFPGRPGLHCRNRWRKIQRNMLAARKDRRKSDMTTVRKGRKDDERSNEMSKPTNISDGQDHDRETEDHVNFHDHISNALHDHLNLAALNLGIDFGVNLDINLDTMGDIHLGMDGPVHHLSSNHSEAIFGGDYDVFGDYNATEMQQSNKCTSRTRKRRRSKADTTSPSTGTSDDGKLERPYKCAIPDCALSFSASSALFYHFKAVHPESKVTRPFQCAHEDCDRTYKNINGLVYHVKSAKGSTSTAVHSKVVLNADGTNPEKPYICTYEGCSKAYRNSNGLLYHQTHYHGSEPPAKGGTEGRNLKPLKRLASSDAHGSQNGGKGERPKSLPSTGDEFGGLLSQSVNHTSTGILDNGLFDRFSPIHPPLTSHPSSGNLPSVDDDSDRSTSTYPLLRSQSATNFSYRANDVNSQLKYPFASDLVHSETASASTSQHPSPHMGSIGHPLSAEEDHNFNLLADCFPTMDAAAKSYAASHAVPQLPFEPRRSPFTTDHPLPTLSDQKLSTFDHNMDLHLIGALSRR
ncbi:hypothetical protein BZG36_02145 [Bifiguratus adelaidae]|uniref:Transcriptional activator Myb n=1 Tax=Bifiguratus adelaidae TaxID=1938954 RepID=A0A261Y331_9FUNG|nr:hypothetical protein BZG36_02145 [Bifiguratus adelaidae]